MQGGVDVVIVSAARVAADVDGFGEGMEDGFGNEKVEDGDDIPDGTPS